MKLCRHMSQHLTVEGQKRNTSWRVSAKTSLNSGRKNDSTPPDDPHGYTSARRRARKIDPLLQGDVQRPLWMCPQACLGVSANEEGGH